MKYRVHLLLAVFAVSAIARGDNPPPLKSVEIKNDAGVHFGTLQTGKNSLLLTDESRKTLTLASCKDEPLAQSVGPDGIRALAILRDCGASVDFSTLVIAVSNSDARGLVAFSGKPKVKLEWRDEGLLVHHSPMLAKDIFLADPGKAGFPLKYVADLGPAELTRPDLLIGANANFGATGRAAGVPAEVLLRWAGWAQQAAGLHRPEWGVWYGEAPYGDSPEEQSAVKDGIAYAESME